MPLYINPLILDDLNALTLAELNGLMLFDIVSGNAAFPVVFPAGMNADNPLAIALLS
jgi:hypothetical protein